MARAFDEGAEWTEPWRDPQTVASGLCVPVPFGGRLILTALRETGGSAIAVTDEELSAAARRIALSAAIDACPEGGATLAGLEQLVERGEVTAGQSVVLFNTGAGWLYR